MNCEAKLKFLFEQYRQHGWKLEDLVLGHLESSGTNGAFTPQDTRFIAVSCLPDESALLVEWVDRTNPDYRGPARNYPIRMLQAGSADKSRDAIYKMLQHFIREHPLSSVSTQLATSAPPAPAASATPSQGDPSEWEELMAVGTSIQQGMVKAVNASPAISEVADLIESNGLEYLEVISRRIVGPMLAQITRGFVTAEKIGHRPYDIVFYATHNYDLSSLLTVTHFDGTDRQEYFILLSDSAYIGVDNLALMASGAIAWPAKIRLVPAVDMDNLREEALSAATDMAEDSGEDDDEYDIEDTAADMMEEEVYRVLRFAPEDVVFITGSPHQDGARIGLSIAKMLMGKAAPRPKDVGIANDKPVEELKLRASRSQWFD
jgi:hypothetical protein